MRFSTILVQVLYNIYQIFLETVVTYSPSLRPRGLEIQGVGLGERTNIVLLLNPIVLKPNAVDFTLGKL